MRTIAKAQRIVADSPREALGDALGMITVALLIFGGFTVPAFL